MTRSGVLSGGAVNLRAAVAYGLGLRAIADRWQADVVHSNGLKMHLLSILTRRPKRRLLVWHIRDVLTAAYMPRRNAAAVRALVRRVPDVTICISEVTRAALGSAVGKSGTLHVVSDGICCPPEAAASPRPTGKCVLMLGRIAAWKGQDVFVRAARRLCADDRDTHFVIAGGATTAADAEYERQLRAMVASAGLSERVTFAGVVADVAQLLSGVDVVVHCSTSPEPFGLVIIEAMAASVPIVATNMGGPAEVIDDRVSGCLYPPGDDGALARILHELLADPALRLRLGSAGRRTVAERFGIERTVAAITAIYRQGVRQGVNGEGP